MPNTPNKHYKGKGLLTEAIYELRDLADGFSVTMQSTLADKINLIADKISNAFTFIDAAYSELLDESTKAINQGTTNMINAALTMSEMCKKDKDV